MPDDVTVVDSSTESVAADDTAQEITSSTDGVESAESTENQQTDDVSTDTEGTDQASAANQVKSYIEELKKTNPALAKELKNLHFSSEAFKKEFPGGLVEVRKLKETVDNLGGSEGIEKLNAQRQEWDEIDNKFAAGDATVLDKFAEFNPEGFAKLIPAALDKLASVDKDTYNHALAGIFVSTLDNWRFSDSLERMADRLARIVDKDGNKLCEEEIKALGKLAEQYDGLKNLAANAPKRNTDDASNKLKEQETRLQQERTQIAVEYVTNATESYAAKKYDALIPAEARNQNLKIETLKTAGSYDRFIRQIDEEIAREISKDKPSVQKIQAAIQSGRKDDAVKLSNAKFETVAPKVIKNVVREWATLMNPAGASSRSAKSNGQNGSSPTPAGVKKLDAPPDIKLVKKDDPNWRENYMMYSKATLTTGQRVTW